MLIAKTKQKLKVLYFDRILWERCQRIDSDLLTKQFKDIYVVVFFFYPRYTLLPFAPAISWYQMCQQPFFYLMNSLKRESSFFESPNGSSYAYSANGHRFESHQNPLEKIVADHWLYKLSLSSACEVFMESVCVCVWARSLRWASEMHHIELEAAA